MFDFTNLPDFLSIFSWMPADLIAVFISVLGILGILALWRAIK